jgi:hypothetical protein
MVRAHASAVVSRRAYVLSPGRPLRALSPAVERLEGRTLLATFVVTDAGDAGPGTLRQAILDANTLAGADTITFDLPGNTSVRTIRPLSALPEVTGQTTIDGRTQAGAITELDGSLAGPGANGLTVSGSNSLVRGMVINRFGGHGILLGSLAVPRPPTPTGIRLEGNLIGTDAEGNVDLGNGGAGVVVAASGTTIGPQTTNAPAGSRNVISGNGYAGIWVPMATGAVSALNVYGNYIGTNAGGSRALGNGREGILVESPGLITIGGTAAAQRNVISGNASSGVRLATATSASITIQNNYIGTDFAGAGAIPNGWSAAVPYHDGVTVATPGIVRIGGPQTPNAASSVRNVISGNAGAGVNVTAGNDVQVTGNFIGTDATGNADVGNGGHGLVLEPPTIQATPITARVTGNLISGNGGDGVRAASTARLTALGGNYIGTNATGTAALGNGGNGVTLAGVSAPTQVGTPGPRPTFPPTVPPQPINGAGTAFNLISANGGDGVRVLAGGNVDRVTVQNCYIGTDVTGNVPLGNRGSGVYIAANNVTVGGASPFFESGPGNLISANGGNGVTIVGTGAVQQPSSIFNSVLGNRIGVASNLPRIGATIPLDPGANTGLGNRGHGVAVYNSANNRIGGTTTGSGNSIAYNDGNGVLVEGGLTPPGSILSTAEANLISSNAIYGNGKLGIDLSLGGEGPTPNDARDADSGPNGLQNFPVITEAIVGGASVQIRFMLLSTPGRSYRVEFFASPFTDPSGYGEGRTYLGMTTVNTDPSGGASGTFTGPLPTGSGLYFTATATQTASTNTGGTSEFSPAVHGEPPAPPPTPQDVTTVTQRSVFYNGGAFDGQAAPDKVALLPGQAPSYSNVTSYDKGINGIHLMFFSLSTVSRPQLNADDLELKVGTGGDPSGWAAGPAPDAVTLVPVPGPNTVYDVTWPNGAIRNTWLQVRIKANAATGLAAPDVFYFGNLVGETGDAVTPLRVTALDVAGTRAHLGESAGLDSRFDHNRDGVVNALDVAAVKSGLAHALGTIAAPPGDAILPVPNDDGAAELASVTRDVLG